MLEGFAVRRIETSGTAIEAAVGGTGPPLLLLHGYPQTRIMWRKIAPALARRFTVVATDLRGYGASGRPPAGDDHAGYSKRAMALDQVEVMRTLGLPRFAAVGHDRGARVVHRMCLDHPDAVERAAVLDILPTAEMYARADRAFATAYWHWFFLIQPHDLPERMIGGDPDFFIGKVLRAWGRREDVFEPEAVEAYKSAFRDPATIHATCEDYRAAATIDLEHDAADAARKIGCPLLVLWGENGVVGRLYQQPLTSWRQKAENVQGRALPGGHFLPEEAPRETLDALLEFLAH